MNTEREYTPPITLDNGGIELDTTPDSEGDLELITTLEDMHVGYLRLADQLILRDLLNRLHPQEPRTITTAEELDALPEGSVIRDNDGDVFEAVRCTGDTEAGVPDYNCWDQIAETWPMDSDKIALPVTVLDEAAL